MVYAVSQMAEEQEPRLRAEAEAFGVDVPALLDFANHSDPEAALQLYRDANPDLNVSHKKLATLSSEGRLTTPLPSVATSLLHMHLNRLLRGNNTAQEAVICDFLARLYEGRTRRAR